MSVVIYDNRGNIAGKQRDDGSILPFDDTLADWLDKGVPGYETQDTGEALVDMPATILPTDPWFQLALLDHFDSIGWKTREKPDSYLPSKPVNHLKRWITKGKGTCKPGQTAAQTGCIPATGEGHKKPRKPEEAKPEPSKPSHFFAENKVGQKVELIKNSLGIWDIYVDGKKVESGHKTAALAANSAEELYGVNPNESTWDTPEKPEEKPKTLTAEAIQGTVEITSEGDTFELTLNGKVKLSGADKDEIAQYVKDHYDLAKDELAKLGIQVGTPEPVAGKKVITATTVHGEDVKLIPQENGWHVYVDDSYKGKFSDPGAAATYVEDEFGIEGEWDFGDGAKKEEPKVVTYTTPSGKTIDLVYHAFSGKWSVVTGGVTQMKGFESQEAAYEYAKSKYVMAKEPTQPFSTEKPKLPTNSLVDVTKWDDTKPFAQDWAESIAKMEKLAGEGKWDEAKNEIKNAFGYETAALTGFAKDAVEAWNKLQAKKNADAPAKKDISKWKEVGGQLGSNPGKQMEDENGQKYYVKFSKSAEIAHNEVLASKLYELAGSGVPELDLVDTDEAPDGVGITSKWLAEGKSFNPSQKIDQIVAQRDFATHAWLANWDCIGTGGSWNQQYEKVGSTNVLKTIDVGGALNHKATGGTKPFLHEVKEWNSLRDPNKNEEGAKVFGSMTLEQLKQSAQKVAQVSDDQIKAMVEKYGHPDLPKQAMINILIARKNWIKEWAESQPSLKGPGEAPKVEKPAPKPKIPKPKTPEPEVSEKGPAPGQLPEMPSCITDKALCKQLQGILDAAKKGLKALEKKKTTPHAKTWGGQKAHLFKMQCLSVLQGGVYYEKPSGPPTPPSKPKPVSALPEKTKPAAGEKVPTENFPEKPKFESKNVANVAQNQKAVQELYDLAAAGDLEALKAHAGTPSEKVQGYKNGLVWAVNKHLNPPPPPKKYHGLLKDISSKVFKGPKHAQAEGAETIGYYLVTDNPGTQDIDIPEVEYKINSSIRLVDKDEQKRHDDAWDSLKPKTRQAIKHYTGTGSGMMNGQLHGKYEMTDAARKVAKDYLANCIELQPGAIIHRGMGVDSAMVEQIKNAVGKVLQEPAYAGASVVKGFSGNLRWHLKALPGFRAMYIGEKSENASTKESEMIPPPGTRYWVQSWKPQTGHYADAGGIDVYAYLLPTEEGQCCE